ncbi:hypothetical protein HPC49_01630 [Pyxidicoccus fallax]|uniref:Uncharacterized protein n=1 Tax=Pyxidicoccus fallax TaxID=394095 RepID=A0A848LFV1_9BACT|nr:hypothetical protein [Pyxidicoccus fallax]NMO16033.1 hypothetical protein [Pyxidicoccus fallax]NPC76954.1 hypothetical protein [Pyxidicoccus fallax]
MAAVLAVVASACQDAATASGTALYVTTEFDPLLQLTQFKVSGTVTDGSEGGDAGADGGANKASSIPASLLPETAGRILQSGETFRVLLPDAKEGARVKLVLEGMSGPELAAVGTAEVTVREGYEVDIRVRLEPASEPPDAGTPDAGTPDSGTPDGGTPDAGSSDAGTFCMDCPDGCCRGGFCVPRTFQSCGVGGVDCTVCDGVRANACSALGTCTCGNGPACTGSNVDRCSNGQCRCGNNNACGAGQVCMDGQCRCTPESCPNGCCDGNVCRAGNEQSRCGLGGQACEQCRRECTSQRTCK